MSSVVKHGRYRWSISDASCSKIALHVIFSVHVVNKMQLISTQLILIEQVGDLRLSVGHSDSRHGCWGVYGHI